MVLFINILLVLGSVMDKIIVSLVLLVLGFIIWSMVKIVIDSLLFYYFNDILFLPLALLMWILIIGITVRGIKCWLAS